jgi:ribosome-associated heat shock protein Hsp15
LDRSGIRTARQEINELRKPFAHDRESLRFAVVSFLTLDASTTPATNARLDKWLWAVRVFKSRALATDACRAGSVEIAGQVAKPAREVRANDRVAVQLGLITRTLRVIGVPKSRVGAKLVPQFYEEMTPETEFAKLREHRVQNLLAREKGSGRPTKRDRRDLTRFFG